MDRTPPLPSPTDPADPLGPALTRRSLLRGAAALGVVGAVGGLGLAACGGGDSDGDDTGGTTDGRGTGADGEALVPWSLVTMLNAAASLEAGAEGRVTLGLGDDRGALVDDAPEQLTFTVTTAGGEVVASDLAVAAHAAGLPHAYYPLVFTPPAAGDHIATTEVDGHTVETAFTVSDPADIVIPRPGHPFPEVTTPTTDAPGTVDPVCTQEPACPLHDEELSTLLGTAPVAVLVSTPAFCQQAICGPVLDVLLGARDGAPGVHFLHVEVFEKASQVEEMGLQAPLAPAVDALRLPFEPCLFLIAADGTLAHRLDVIYDEVELSAALADITP